MKTVHATLRFLRISPRKVRLVADALRGKPVVVAEEQLMFSKKHAARPMLKLIRSAVANARQKQLATDALRITSILVDQGPVLKRYRARAFGSAAPIRKRMSHITVVLEAPEKPVSVKSGKAGSGSAGKESK